MKDDSLEYLTCRRRHSGFDFAFSPICQNQDKIVELVTGRIEPDKYFRKGQRRNVILFGDVVVKFYSFHTLADLFHSRRYGYCEVECHHDFIKAFGEVEGFRLPRLLGYFEKKLFGPIQSANGIICEFIPNTRQLEISELLRAVPLFVQLYRSCIYHPDVNYGNVLYQPETDLIIPIDFMGCNFLSSPNWEALIMEASRFLCTGRIDQSNSVKFMEALLDKLPEVPINRKKIWQGIKCINRLHLTTHQYHNPVFLPEKLRNELTSA